MTFPNSVPVVLAIAIAGSFLPDLAGTIAGIFAASFLVAYAVLGLAVVHGVTRGNPGRLAILFGTYFVIFLLSGLPLVVLMLLGLADSIFDFRGRAASRRGPPPRPQT
jgi:hypothetical protein